MLKNKVVVITGGAGRIGSEFARAVVGNRATAVIVDTNEQLADRVIAKIADELSKEVQDALPEILFFNADISSDSSINSIIESLHNKFGRINALVNNAYPRNKNYGKKFFEIDMDDFNEFLNLHLGGYFNISQNFIKYFLRQGYGDIVNISSIQGIGAPAFETYEGTQMHSPIEYTVVKHGLIGMTKYMAKMFKKDHIRVNAISPGGILDNQPQIFLEQYKRRCGTKGMLDAVDLTSTLIYLLSDSSKYVNGQNIVVDDGFSL